MTKTERREAVVEAGQRRRLYTVEALARSLNEAGVGVDLDDLYAALKASGWIKLRLIRDELLNLKSQMPKHAPFDGVRHIVKAPLLVDRNADLPEWKNRSAVQMEPVEVRGDRPERTQFP